MSAIFHPGQLVATPAALDVLRAANASPLELVHRHINGDFGDLCPDDWQLNIDAIAEAQGDRIMSSYTLAGARVWVATEAIDEDGNNGTTIFLPEEY